MKFMKGGYNAEKFEELIGKMYNKDYHDKEDKVWETNYNVKVTLGRIDEGKRR